MVGIKTKASTALRWLPVAASVAILPLLCTSVRAQATRPLVPEAPVRVNEARLARADREPDQWFTPGRDASGTYYSPLSDINDQNAQRLGFAWEYELNTQRGLEATPLVVDGVMYAVGNWGRVYALDAANGHELWTYNPEPDGRWGRYACCDVVNRGVVAWEGRIYVVSTDAFLHVIDSRTGKRVMKIDTLPDRGPKAFHYSSSGAPMIAGDLIVIGNSGSDFTGARGQVAAFDLRTGQLRWRFYTVPRDPRDGPQDQPHLNAAIKTWPADYDWTQGGGGTAWDGLAYDSALHLIYVGTANPIPYRVELKAQGGHDELYANSLLAIKAESGQLAWYYQEVPGDGWDYDSTQKMVLADLEIHGQSRKVLMHAAKNGYFYVLDRRNGDVISATPFVYTNWTPGLDAKTHRPLPTPNADWQTDPKLIFPSPAGGHNWHPMSYNPQARLLYIPAIEGPMIFLNTENGKAGWTDGSFNLLTFPPEYYDPKSMESLFGKLPPLSQLAPGSTPQMRGVLRAIDASTGKVKWEQPGASIWDSGILSTAGNLVVRGDVSGNLKLYRGDDGRLLTQLDVGTSMMAAPMTYRVKGVQYISIMAGYGGGLLTLPFPPTSAASKYVNQGRIVTFRLDGGSVPKPPPVLETPFPEPPAQHADASRISDGEVLYTRYCARCHVFGRGMLPDLRRLTPAKHQIFNEIVMKGALQPLGMARWDDVLSQKDADDIHTYLIDEAWKARRAGPNAADDKPHSATH
jgi:quinohemoprotein ethanol dehydrogenase